MGSTEKLPIIISVIEKDILPLLLGIHHGIQLKDVIQYFRYLFDNIRQPSLKSIELKSCSYRQCDS